MDDEADRHGPEDASSPEDEPARIPSPRPGQGGLKPARPWAREPESRPGPPAQARPGPGAGPATGPSGLAPQRPWLADPAPPGVEDDVAHVFDPGVAPGAPRTDVERPSLPGSDVARAEVTGAEVARPRPQGLAPVRPWARTPTEVRDLNAMAPSNPGIVLQGLAAEADLARTQGAATSPRPPRGRPHPAEQPAEPVPVPERGASGAAEDETARRRRFARLHAEAEQQWRRSQASPVRDDAPDAAPGPESDGALDASSDDNEPKRRIPRLGRRSEPDVPPPVYVPPPAFAPPSERFDPSPVEVVPAEAAADLAAGAAAGESAAAERQRRWRRGRADDTPVHDPRHAAPVGPSPPRAELAGAETAGTQQSTGTPTDDPLARGGRGRRALRWLTARAPGEPEPPPVGAAPDATRAKPEDVPVPAAAVIAQHQGERDETSVVAEPERPGVEPEARVPVPPPQAMAPEVAAGLAPAATPVSSRPRPRPTGSGEPITPPATPPATSPAIPPGARPRPRPATPTAGPRHAPRARPRPPDPAGRPPLRSDQPPDQPGPTAIPGASNPPPRAAGIAAAADPDPGLARFLEAGEAQAADESEEDKPRRRRRRGAGGRGGKRLMRITITVVILAGAAILLRAYVVSPYYIPSASMEPTLHGCPACNDDHVLVDKISYRLHDPHQTDIVVFDRPAAVRSTDEVLIKRVIAGPGDTLQLRRGRVYVNGTALDESYLNTAYVARECRALHQHVGTYNTFGSRDEWSVPDNELFVMGDNRCDSQDSRAFGPIKKSSVVGRAFAIVWPLKRVRTL